MKTKAKTKAARENGRRGGRPKKEGTDPKRRERYLVQKDKTAEQEKNKSYG